MSASFAKAEEILRRKGRGRLRAPALITKRSAFAAGFQFMICPTCRARWISAMNGKANGARAR